MKFIAVETPTDFIHLIGCEMSSESVSELLELNASEVLARSNMASQLSMDGFVFDITQAINNA